MMPTDGERTVPQVIIVGASRGLGQAMAAEFLRHGWAVTGTVREQGTPLHELAARHGERLTIASLDINSPEQVAALRRRLEGRLFDMLFVNAGTTNRDPAQTIAEVETDDFVATMITNALSPMRVVEALEDLVTADGLIGVMSSGQGSITNNTIGMREVYRGSKAALNMYMSCFAVRQSARPALSRGLVVMAPGWVRTELGGPDASLSIDDSIPSLVQVLLDKRGKAGLEYLDYLGRPVPW